MIWKTLKIKIKKEGVIIRYDKEKGYHVTVNRSWITFSPVFIIKKKLRRMYFNKIHKKYPYLQCHGCGEGLIEYSIADPNYKEGQPGKKRWMVCKDCVNFYDWHHSRREIKIK